MALPSLHSKKTYVTVLGGGIGCRTSVGRSAVELTDLQDMLCQLAGEGKSSAAEVVGKIVVVVEVVEVEEEDKTAAEGEVVVEAEYIR